MRILHVIARLNVGGTSRYLETLSQGLTTAGVENAIATGYVQDGEIEDECVARLPILRVEHLGRAISPLNDLHARQELKKIISEFKPDVIHTHTFKAGLLGRSIKFSGKRVHTYHGHILSDGALSKWQITLVRWSEFFLAGRADVLISVGQQVAKELQELGIGRKSQWISISPGVESPDLPLRQQAIAKLNLNGDRVRVGWLGRMIGVKDPALVLEVARAMPEIEFLMAGGGKLFEDMRRVAPENVKVLGWINRNDLLAASDTILMTSKSEGMPLAAIEAQLSGLSVVAPDVGSLKEVVSHEITGFLTDRNVESLKEALSRVLERSWLEPDKKREIRLQSASRFSIDQNIDRHKRLYDSLVKMTSQQNAS